MKKLLIALMTITALFCLTFAACGNQESGGNNGGGNGGKDDTPTTYTVTIAVDNATYGTVSKTSVANVAKDTAISVNGNVLTIGTETITATPAQATAQYTYAFDEFVYTGTTVTGNITVTAKFTRTVNKYTITFEMGDGVVIAPISVDYGTSASELDTISVTAPEHYHFVKWQLKDGNEYVDFVGTETLESDITVKAVYGRDIYTITYAMGERTGDDYVSETPSAEEIEYGSTLNTLPTVTCEGYFFRGWRAANGEIVVSVSPEEDITLTAVWEKDVSSDRWGAWTPLV